MKWFSALPLFFCLASCMEEKPFVIEGFAPHVDEGVAYLSSGEYMDQTDTLKIIDHQFSFSRKIREPTYYTLVISGREEGNPAAYELMRNIWLEPGSRLKLNLGAVSSPEMELENGDVQFEYEHLRKSRGDVLAYIRAHPESYVSAMELFNYLRSTKDTATASRLFIQLSPEIQKSATGNSILNYLSRDRALRIGGEAPDFTQNDPDGKPLKLSSLRGKYVLVDFWASWCNPCRIDNPFMTDVFRKYHAKGFDIVSVSLDEKKPAWIRAIHEDKLNWMHVSDLKGYGNFAMRQYHVNEIPDNFLLDREGKIIARNLRGKALEKKLGEIL